MSGNMLRLLIDTNPYNLHPKYQSISKRASVLIFETREAFFSNLEIQKWNLLNVTCFQIFDSFSTSLACPCLWPLLTQVVGTN